MALHRPGYQIEDGFWYEDFLTLDVLYYIYDGKIREGEHVVGGARSEGGAWQKRVVAGQNRYPRRRRPAHGSRGQIPAHIMYVTGSKNGFHAHPVF